MKRMRFTVNRQAGFALPTILIASVVMLTILTAAVTAVSSLSAALNTQYYNQIGREAAESGMARAADCLKQSPTSTPQWSELAPLRPNTNCDGSIISGKSQYINTAGNINTSFRVGLPSSGSANSSRIAATGNVNLMRTSDGSTVWRAFSQTVAQDTRYRNAPKLAGGAGWLDTGHIAAIASVDGQVYGFGANTSGQVTDTSSPASALFPLKYSLPNGVASVLKVRTSGQGASFVCILGNNAQVYCRGNGLGGSYTTWTQLSLPGGRTVKDFWTDGYGNDAVCAISNDNLGYCAGESREGSFGNGNTAGTAVYPLSNPQQFAASLPSGVGLRKILPGSAQVCAISNENNADGSLHNRLYCAGRNNAGQIGASTTGSYATPQLWPTPGPRSVQDVTISYHSMDDSPVVHALMSDGTIWSAGNYNYGDVGNGLFTGSTGTSQSPTLFSPSGDSNWMTGSRLYNPNSGRCIDNNGNLTWPNSNTKVQLYDCNGTVAQTWVYGSNKQLTNLGTGQCLDDPGNSFTHGVALQLYQCNGTAAQQYQPFIDANGRQGLKHIASGLCVDATGAGTTNGTQIELWDCYSNGPQNYNNDGGFNGWKDMIVGTDTFCGIRTDQWSGMWCAGKNNWGQLLNYSQPGAFFNPCADVGTTYTAFNVNLPNNVKVNAAALSDEWRQQFQSLQVIGTDGNVYSSGRDQYGKFGTGVVGDSANDYRVCKTYSNVTNMRSDQPGAGAAVSNSFALPSGVTAIDMSTRDQFTTYIMGSDGRIYAAGRNANGQIGDGTTTDRLTPVPVKIPWQGTAY